MPMAQSLEPQLRRFQAALDLGGYVDLTLDKDPFSLTISNPKQPEHVRLGASLNNQLLRLGKRKQGIFWLRAR